jgi:ketosteroid isomerase-like protein
MEYSIETFYEAFQDHDPVAMWRHYADDALFHDPVFEYLKGEEILAMWHMLIERSKGNLSIAYRDVQKEKDVQSCIWEADYFFGPKKRPVHNVVKATMHWKEGKIHEHYDDFDLWRWTRMALGAQGLLLGWSPAIHRKIKSKVRKALDDYMHHENLS